MSSERDVRAAVAADAEARERALDVSRSFLVQAPAGSGKTELLIQRFLALLACVERPEQILAMTFTRKAAGEMRERIVAALRTAAPGLSPPAEEHERRTWSLAKSALGQDARQGWRLVDHPSRLAVQTIDSFCTGLAQQAPLATRFGAAPRFVDFPRPLHEDAVREALAAAPGDDPAWRRLLRHVDNNAETAVALLADLLGKRDRLRPVLDAAGNEGFRAALEQVLRAEIEDELASIRAAFPAGAGARLLPLLRHAVANARGAARVEPRRDALDACVNAGGLPPARADCVDAWNALSQWLLVGSGPRFRTKIDTHDGFPAKGSGPDASARGARNDEMRTLLAHLAGVPGLAEALDAARRLPPASYADETWSAVSALAELLPRLDQPLQRAFRDAGALDFVQGAMAAAEALGGEDLPSDLLLKLDWRFQHLLVDEFQDTSYGQLDLLRRLTAGWQPGDGRTLFAVGDPMQSIYRFRGAEVRIFVEAQEERAIGRVAVECLRLQRNFRSHAGLVDWVNCVFGQVLPSRDDRWRGAVRFAAATASRAGPADAAGLRLFADVEGEAAYVVRCVREALDRGEKKIAVLARARTHLESILRALRDGGIAYAAVDLDRLAERQAILDLASLTHALVQPADRLAWLSVLRAPWCGLALPDLFAVARAADAAGGSIADVVLSDGVAFDGMSGDGRARLEASARALEPVVAMRGRASLVARVRGAWLALGGPATLAESIDVEAAARYFALLAEHEVGGDVRDWPALRAALEELRAAPAPDADDRVQVMTLHKAKGLQFDTVVLPGLARGTRHGDPEALRLRVRKNGLLLAPRQAVGDDDDPLYDYLGFLGEAEESAELGRLLYVGATRARSRLHLTAVLGAQDDDDGNPGWTVPRKGSALAQLWTALATEVPPPTAAGRAEDAPATGRSLLRMPSGWRPQRPDAGVPVPPHEPPRREAVPFDWALETAKHVGVVAHRLLAQVAGEGLASWNDARVESMHPRIRTELAGEGVDDAALDRAAAEVATAVRNAIADPRGRFVLDASHADAASEWALAGIDDGAIVHVVLDRTFVADGVRWIVDFKTGRHEGADVDAFLASEVARYSPQLERYARLVRALDTRPIRLALYYPLLRALRDWPYAG